MPSFSTVFATLLALSTSAFAYTTPTTFNQTLDPIFTPTLGELVPVGKPFKVTWKPTEKGTVSLVLLRGPSTNVKPLYAIAEGIANSGSYEWTPKSDLEPDTTHYGIQLIVDANGQYQYSVQFGIKNESYKPGSTTTSSHTGSATSSGSGKPTTYSTAEPTTTSVVTATHTTHSTSTSLITITTSASTSSSTVTSTTYAPPYTNSTTTGTKTSTTSASTSTPPPSEQTGAASSVKVATGLFAGVVGIAALLL